MIAIIAVSVAATLISLNVSTDTAAPKSGAFMAGNVIVKVTDENGFVKALRQTDNHIVLNGMELIARQVFTNAGAAGSNNTNATGGGQIRYMEIGNGTGFGGGGAVLGFDNQTLQNPLDNCARENAVVTRFDAGESSPGSDAAQINVTAVATFSGAAGCDAGVIQEAGIWNNSTNSATSPGNGPQCTNDADACGGYINTDPNNVMFARNTFGSVNLSTSDSLELTWRFTFTDS